MYDISDSTSLYDLTLKEFKAKVNGTFILSGAFCTLLTNPNPNPGSGTQSLPKPAPGTKPGSPGSTQNPPLVLNSQGFTYSGNTNPQVPPVQPPSTPGPSTPPSVIPPAYLDDKDILVKFVFYKKYDEKLPEDIHGSLYLDDGQYVLHIENQVTVIDTIGHDDFKIRLTQRGPLTVAILRDILAKIRGSYYLLDKLDHQHDVLPIPSTDQEKDAILDKIREYTKLCVEKGYILDFDAKSTTDIIDQKLVDFQIRKKDGSKAEKDIVSIELYKRKFEPSIILKTYFKNDDAQINGGFVILDKNKDPYVITKTLSKEEADYFIKGIAHIAADIPGYNYVIDVTP